MNSHGNRRRPPIWVALEGVHNMRDIGGYVTAAGQAIRTGIVYRSDTLEHATDADISHLKALGIKVIIDVRTLQESSESLERYRLAHDEDIHYVCLPTIPEGIMASRAFPVGDPNAIGDLYFENLLECRDSSAAVFELLASSDVAAVVHCAAGRDRTGVISSLLLSHAGVSDEQIALDYTATSSRVRLLYDELARNPLYQESRIANPSELTAEAQTIYRFLDNVRKKFGGVSPFIESLIGDESAERLRNRLVGQ